MNYSLVITNLCEPNNCLKIKSENLRFAKKVFFDFCKNLKKTGIKLDFFNSESGNIYIAFSKEHRIIVQLS